jgi:cobalt-zinc-cadmium efflux system protein
MGGVHDHNHSSGLRHDAASAGADRGWLAAALTLIVGFMVVEIVVGVLSGSLALLSDAAHMLTDAVALGLALLALRLARTPPRGGYTFGLKRAEILSAQANGITLLLLAGWLGYEAVARLIEPHPVDGLPVLVTALVGIGINLVATWFVGRADRRSLNIEGAYQHILTDLAGFVATAVAAAVIMATGWRQADTLASLLVAALMLRAGYVLVRGSLRVLLEAAPAGLEPDRIGPDMIEQDGVVEVHDLHVWEITSGSPAISAHILVAPEEDCHLVRLGLENMLRERYGLTHTTLQVDHARPELYRLEATRTGIGGERPRASS